MGPLSLADWERRGCQAGSDASESKSARHHHCMYYQLPLLGAASSLERLPCARLLGQFGATRSAPGYWQTLFQVNLESCGSTQLRAYALMKHLLLVVNNVTLL